MAESPLASARLPQEWMAQLDEIAQQTGKSRTDLVREAIAMYLGVIPPEGVRSDLEQLKNRVEIVEKKLQIQEYQTS
ncbi:MAG TPA: ribbon-helix-helix protein, CopG family [Oculatellaceae cyanobacterium]|jgi:hypothetical protein|uniref:CopG-like domain-containing DNA-binding domain n=1 Tax=Crinalium epipsammum PCC 9333 TaxID=1173022 RepID=K9W727_9CYAN|nr:ribbon-helix-helix protein, CopG family [Crinalium epipsammum]AFZ15552.1 CopG-like domain-containing DNA-binding domain [Crinalium epipsammum PCC 9333]